MTRHPTGDANPDSRQFLTTDPRPRQACNALGDDPEIGGCLDQDLLEIAHVPMHIASIGPQIHDRISNDLPRSMVRHVTASTGLVDLYPTSCQLISTRQDVSPPAIVSNTERQDVRMLDEQQDIRDAVALPVFDERSLKRESIRVRDQSQTTYFQRLQLVR